MTASMRVAAVASLLLLPLACGSAPARTGASADVHALTGAPTRVVWVQGDGTDPFAAGRNLVLMGLDTEDGKGERVVLGERGSYVEAPHHPLRHPHRLLDAIPR